MTTTQLDLTNHPHQVMLAKHQDRIRDAYALQHFVMTHPELPLDYLTLNMAAVSIPHAIDEDGLTDWDKIDVARVAELVRIMKDGGMVTKHPTESFIEYRRKFGLASVCMFVPRNAVCERRVVGTETVVHAAVAGYTETVETVEWDCAPILDKALD